MRFGIDHSTSPPPDAAELVRAGVTFVCRYLSTRGNPKNITAAEASALHKAGIDIVLVFETTRGRAVDGRPAGLADAQAARAQAREAGLPAAPIYFAVDFDATPTQQEPINAYLAAAASMLGHDRTGVYGGYHVIRRALNANVCKYAWQTYAWSGGQWEPRAQLQQYRNGQRLAGIKVDFNHATSDDFGQAPRSDARKLQRLPGPLRKPAWFWAALTEFLRRRRPKRGGR
ncbi:MAG TPA: glycoside hydrolase domain-containing protein [Gaiellaceae bacterium]|jgi:hypothetical protein